jgi:hypothetical protein
MLHDKYTALICLSDKSALTIKYSRGDMTAEHSSAPDFVHVYMYPLKRLLYIFVL